MAVWSLVVGERVGLTRGAALLAAVATMGAACSARDLEGDTGGTTQGDDGSSGAATMASSDGGSTDAAVECPPAETAVEFSTVLLDDVGESIYFGGSWSCVVTAVELTGGALEVELDCPVESWSGFLTHVSVATNPPLVSHGFIVGESIQVDHFSYTWGKFQRIKRLDETLLLLGRWGWPETTGGGVIEYGEELCHIPDPVGRVAYTDVEVDVGEGVFVVPPYAHAEHGSYAAWTGNTAAFVPEKSTVKQYFDLDAIVVRRAP